MENLLSNSSLLSQDYSGLQSDIANRILDALTRNTVCEMEEIFQACSSYTWNQVFLEVDRLSRTGQLRLLPKSPGVYAVTLPAHTRQPVH